MDAINNIDSLNLNLNNNPYNKDNNSKSNKKSSKKNNKDNKDKSSEELAQESQERLNNTNNNANIDPVDVELEALEENYNGFYAMLQSQNVWGHDKKGLKAIQASMAMLSTKTGIYARIPIFCKGGKCPYSQSCGLDRWGLTPEGQACPVEIAMIQQKYANYSEEFGLDSGDASYTDQNIVNEIITMEIYMERCKAIMSKEVSPIQMTVVGLDESGAPIESPNVSKAVEAYEKFSKKRNDNYSLLMATRKDKKKDGNDNKEMSIIDIMNTASEDEDFYNIDKRPDHIEGVD